MEFSFNCECLLGCNAHGIAVVDSNMLRNKKCNPQIMRIIDIFGELSAKVSTSSVPSTQSSHHHWAETAVIRAQAIYAMQGQYCNRNTQSWAERTLYPK